MDALTLLKEQHDEVDELFARIESADDIATKAELFEELADKLAAHSKIEETQSRLKQVDTDLGDPDIYRDKTRTTRLLDERAELAASLEALETEWLRRAEDS